MVYFRGLLNILLVLVIFGTATCDLKPCGWFASVTDSVIDKAHNCAETDVTESESLSMLRAKTTEEVQQFFVGYCQRQSGVRDCLVRETKYFERCANETYVTAFKFYRGILETILDVECSGGGGRLATLWRGIHIFASNREDLEQARNCYLRVEELVKDIKQSNIDVPSQIFVAYKETAVFKECFLQLEMEPAFKQVVDTVLGEVIDKMKCINPKDGSLVLCSTIDTGLLSATSICDVKTNSNEIPVYDALENQSFRCYKFLLERLGDLEEVNEDFLPYICRPTITDWYKDCLTLIRPHKAKCLNETQQQEFTVFYETIKQLLNASCIEDGQPLIDVMVQVYDLQHTLSEHNSPVLECLDAVRSYRKQTGVVYTSNNMRYYHELETFKDCLSQKLQGRQASVQAVTKIYNELRKRAKCFNPEDGNTVLCESLVH